ncbi:MAG: hypothetical protein WKG06_34890 [Segetibacter sp.]
MRYSDYADAQLTDIFTEEQLVKARTVNIKTLQSIYLPNDGNKKFTIKALPQHAQISAINGMVAEDIDKDGNKDLIIAGNFYPLRVSLGPLDAGLGLVLKGNGKGEFKPMTYEQTGLNISGDVRNLINVRTKENSLFLAGKNNGKLQIVRLIQ